MLSLNPDGFSDEVSFTEVFPCVTLKGVLTALASASALAVDAVARRINSQVGKCNRAISRNRSDVEIRRAL